MPNADYLPNWADDIGELESYILKARSEAINAPSAGGTGQSVHVGIIDSAHTLPEGFVEGKKVNQGVQNSFLDGSQADTTNHCKDVFSLLSAYCPEATISLYQALNDDGRIPLEAYSEAITRAINDDVDILNVSAGDPWRAEISLNPNIPETKRALEEGITIVAAAGNWRHDEDQPPVHCPAALEDVIAVGGMVTDCPAEIGSEPSDEQVGPYYIEKDEDEEYEEAIPEDGFCGWSGCVDKSGCFRKQIERPWEYNPYSSGNKPDILAPVYTTGYSENGYPILNCGTSFAAPIVAGELAAIMDEARNDNRMEPSPFEMRRAVIDGGRRIDEGSHLKFDAMGTRKELGLE